MHSKPYPWVIFRLSALHLAEYGGENKKFAHEIAAQHCQSKPAQSKQAIGNSTVYYLYGALVYYSVLAIGSLYWVLAHMNVTSMVTGP